MTNMSVHEIVTAYGVSPFRAKNTYNRIRQELGESTFSEQFQYNKKSKHQWLLDHQDEFLNQGKTIAELAEKFEKTKGKILRAKAKLREILKIPKVKDQNQTWLFANQKMLLDSKLSKEEIAKKIDIEPSQVIENVGN